MKQILKFDTLFKKILLSYGIALLLFAVITGVLFGLSYARYTYDTYLIEMAKSISQSVSEHVENSGYALGSKEPSEIRTYTNLISSTSNLSSITVWIVTDKRELMSLNSQSGRLEFDQIPTRYTDMLDQLLEGRDVHHNTYKTVWNRNMFGVGTPIMDSGGFIIGVVLVQTSFDMVADALKTALSNLFFSLLVAMAITLVIAISVSRILTQPLQKIHRSALQLREGNYNVTTDVDQSDELGQLADAIDDLALRLAKAKEESDGLEKMRQDFISGISHELRTPVTVMRASLEAFCDGYITDPEKAAQYHRAMLRDSIQLQRLINDLLDLSRLQTTEFNMDMAPCNPCELIQDSISSVQALADQNGVAIELLFRCDNCCHCSIHGDYGRIRQLFVILMDNAIKFTPAGKKITVSILYTDHLVCTVADEGCGIAAEDLPSIFDRFYRGQTTAGREGSGLGLAIASQIAGYHNIDIQVESQPDHGTTFTLTFPGVDTPE